MYMCAHFEVSNTYISDVINKILQRKNAWNVEIMCEMHTCVITCTTTDVHEKLLPEGHCSVTNNSLSEFIILCSHTS